MELATVPGLTSALRDRGYGLRGPLGIGGSGPAWGVDAPDGRRAIVTVLDLKLTVAARRAALERLDVLRSVSHPHLVPLLDAVAIDSHRTALVTAEVDGPTAGAVFEVRGAWRPGEVVTLVAPIADALATLRSAGLDHGDIAPDNVVLAPGGRPVLIDLASIVLPPTGTPGFAPSRGTDGVFSLARLGLAALGATAGVEDAADAGLRAALEAACSSRTAPRDLAQACFEAAGPEPIEMPEAGVLTRIALTRMADLGPPVRTVQDPRVARRRRVLVTAGALAAAAAVVVVLATVGPRDPNGPGGMAVTAGHDSAPVDAQVVEAAVALTHRRAAVLAARSPEHLIDVALPGSAAFEADHALVMSLQSLDEALDVQAEEVEAEHLGRRDDLELVRVRSRLRVLGAEEVPPVRSVVLALTATPAGWRVVEVLDPVELGAVDGDAVTVPVGPLAG